MRFLLPLAALFSTAAAPTPDVRFDAIWRDEWRWRVAEGIADDDPAKVASHLPDTSAAAHAKRQARWTTVLHQLDAIDPATLSPQARENWQVYRQQIASLLDDERFHEWEKPVNGDSAFWSDLQYAARGGFANGEADYRAYLSQLADQPRYIDGQIAAMRAGLQRGFTPPAVVMTGRDKPVAAVADARDSVATVYYQPFLALPSTLSPATRAALQADAKRVIAADVIPAHRRLLAFLRDTYFPGLRTRLDASSYPDGVAYYQSRIRAYTTTDLTPARIHAIGLAEVASIKAEMEGVRTQVGFEGDLSAFLRFLRTDPQFYPKTPDELLKEAAWEAKRFDGMASTWFGHLPRSRFAIVPVPPEIAPYYTAGRGGPGQYLINTYDFPRARCSSCPR